MSKTIKLSPFTKDVAFTTITSIVTIFSIIIVTRFLAQGLGSEGFGAYSLTRRILAVICPFVTLQMGIALARYVAISKDDYSKYSYLLSAVILSIVPTCLVLIIGLLFTKEFTLVIFNNAFYSSLFVATLFMVFGYSFYIVLYAFYRGLGQMGKANLWQLASAALCPILISCVYSKSGEVDLIVFLMGIGFFISFIPLAFYIFKIFYQDKQIIKIRVHIKELFLYGLPRVPSGITSAGIFSIGPFLAPYFGSLKDAGYLVVGQSLIRIIEGGLVAFGLVILPKAAQLFAEGKNEFLKERIIDIITFTFHIGLFLTLHFFLFADKIVLVWLGEKYLEAVPLMRILLFTIIPYLIYVMFYSVIDAIEKKAINTYNLYIAFTITLSISFILAKLGFGVIGLAIGMATGFLTIGFLTVCYLWKRYQLRSEELMIKECLFLNIVFIIISFFIKYWLDTIFNALISIISIIIVCEGILLFLYCFILWKLNVRWTIELAKRIIRGGG